MANRSGEQPLSRFRFSTDGGLLIGWQDCFATPSPTVFSARFNHIHDYGLFGKQTSCYFQSKSCANTIEFNVCYNGQ